MNLFKNCKVVSAFYEDSSKSVFAEVFNNSKKGHKNAFTLAEVLITLGIIGIIAALTLPPLIENYRKQNVEVQVKHFYSMMLQAIKMSELTNEAVENWTFTTSSTASNKEFAKTYILPFLTGMQYCGEGMYSKDSETYRLCGVPFDTNAVVYRIPNNSCMSIEQSTGAIAMVMSVDINCGVKPNNYRDNYQFALTKSGKLVPLYYATGMTRSQVIEGISRISSMWGTSSGTYACNLQDRRLCTALLMMDGWKFENDYPW